MQICSITNFQLIISFVLIRDKKILKIWCYMMSCASICKPISIDRMWRLVSSKVSTWRFTIAIVEEIMVRTMTMNSTYWTRITRSITTLALTTPMIRTKKLYLRLLLVQKYKHISSMHERRSNGLFGCKENFMALQETVQLRLGNIIMTSG